ncbi:class I SAM-dependent methyltransferase [Flavihumibacter sp. R14]|nr:class I SAM-dependent methyltransferase [Flavihumibacter soli]
MKDNFSAHASIYAQFRPVYPAELYDFILPLVQSKTLAWDCGCGNGQVAGVLADHFNRVEASDISQKQLENAIKKDNINYQLTPAENVSIPDRSVDLVTVAQAIHWFDFDNFYKEVYRVCKPGSLIAIWCYSLLTVNKKVDAIIWQLYEETLGDRYWDPERRYVDEHYQTIPFPFEEITAPSVAIRVKWEVDHLIGYLNSWSAVQHYIRDNNNNPVDAISSKLREAWGEQRSLEVCFPLFTRIGRI